MIVVVQHDSIIINIGRTYDVGTFKLDYLALQKVPIVDDDIIYMCLYTDKPYVLIIRNSSSVTIMKQNLLPPFITIQPGVPGNSYPNIQARDPTYNDCYIHFCGNDFIIPLSLGRNDYIFYVKSI